MKHPQREEWVPFLFGEAGAEARTRLAAHLEECPECAAELGAWRRSLGRLDQWQLPARETVRRARAGGWRWAVPASIAASIVLGLGFGLGWIAKSSGANAAALRAEVQSSVKAALASDVRPHIVAEVERASAQAHEQTAESLAALELRLARASELSARQVLQGLTSVLNSAREEDRQLLATLLEQLQEQHATDYVSLRKDLETLATLTDEEMRQARSKLNHLAARTLSDNEP